jgi:predicted phosphohydrolase
MHTLVEKEMGVLELKSQHRMQPQLSKFIMATLYPGFEGHSSVTNMCEVKGVNQNVFFVTHEHMADKVHDFIALAQYYIIQMLFVA